MSVTVIRGLGDKPGENIVSSVLSTQVLQVERGRQEINSHDSDRIQVSGSVIGTEFVPPGSIVQVSEKGNQKNGYLTGISLVIDMSSNYSATSNVQIEQVDDE